MIFATILARVCNLIFKMFFPSSVLIFLWTFSPLGGVVEAWRVFKHGSNDPWYFHQHRGSSTWSVSWHDVCSPHDHYHVISLHVSQSRFITFMILLLLTTRYNFENVAWIISNTQFYLTWINFFYILLCFAVSDRCRTIFS